MTKSIHDYPGAKARILALVESEADRTGACWLWTGATGKGGYGNVGVGRGTMLAHRASYEAHSGERIPAGMKILHSCDTPACVNPAHLRVGTDVDNMRDRRDRGNHPHANRTHCPKGHVYDAANTYVNKRGERQCRACSRARNARYRATRKENAR